MGRGGPDVGGTSSAAPGAGYRMATTGPSWLLRQLRPVSFRFRRQPEAKFSESPQRFGFLADEVQHVLPDIVRTMSSYRGHRDVKAVAYQDLIALIVAAQQAQQQQVAVLQQEHGALREEHGALRQEHGALQQELGS